MNGVTATSCNNRLTIQKEYIILADRGKRKGTTLMNYIVFDLEWNQCPYGKGQENERIPFEIIEIGAVKLNSERQIIDQYQVLIQPRVYKKLHHRTREIIQMDMKLLEREGIPFYRAVKEFLKWCGEDAIFCSWGNS